MKFYMDDEEKIEFQDVEEENLNETDGKLKFELEEISEEIDTKIKIMGVGGCGCNIINDMYKIGLNNVDLIAINTDIQALNNILSSEKVQIGRELTKGRGSGNNPEIGAKAAEEDKELIESKLVGTDMLFITAGLGGGTGSGASPIIAELARNMGILTVAILITPFEDELDDKKRKIVNSSLSQLREKVNAVVIISNEKIYEVFNMNTTLEEAYKKVNERIIKQISGIIKMITIPGSENIDFEDVKNTLKMGGEVFIGVSKGEGMDKAKKAFEEALKDPFTGRSDLKGAKSMLVNFIGEITLQDRKSIIKIKDYTGENISIKSGIVPDPSMKGEIEVTILIAGMNAKEEIKPEDENIDFANIKNSSILETLNSNYDSNIIDIPAYIRMPFLTFEKNKN